MEPIKNKILEYNKKMNHVSSVYTEKQYAHYTTEHKSQLIADEQKKIVSEFVNISKLSKDETYSAIKRKLKERNSIRFPLRFADDIQKNILAEIKSQRAYNFLNATTDYKKIEGEIRNALDSDTDYFSSLMELILLKLPDEGTGTKEQNDFYRNVKKLSDSFEQKSDINRITVEIKQAEKLNLEWSGFLKALEAGLPQYFSESMVKNMEQKAVHEQIENLDKSTPMWR